jgi:HlyD family secretion protein
MKHLKKIQALEPKKRTILIAAAAAVLIAAGAAAYYFTAALGSAVPVKMAALTQGTVRRTVSAPGTVESTSTEQVTNTSGGTVTAIYVSAGDWVDQGKRLAALYDKASESTTYVTAPAAGTITAVSVQNGAAANGSLFTIENTGSLRLRIRIKQADMGTVRTGQAVLIKTDATGDKTYSGTILSIAPTAAKAAAPTSGSSQSAGGSTGSPEFEGVVRIDSDSAGLLIGMKARATIVAEEHQNVFSVDFAALKKNDDGSFSVLAAADEQDGVYTVKEIPVTRGIESDFAVEISGEGLTPGMMILTETDKAAAGDQVVAQTAETEPTAAGGGTGLF